MNGFPKSTIMITGAVIALLGVLAIAVPVFTTQQTKDVVKLGDLKLTAQEETSHTMPPFVGPAALLVGLILIGVGFTARR